MQNLLQNHQYKNTQFEGLRSILKALEPIWQWLWFKDDLHSRTDGDEDVEVKEM